MPSSHPSLGLPVFFLSFLGFGLSVFFLSFLGCPFYLFIYFTGLARTGTNTGTPNGSLVYRSSIDYSETKPEWAKAPGSYHRWDYNCSTNIPHSPLPAVLGGAALGGAPRRRSVFLSFQRGLSRSSDERGTTTRHNIPPRERKHNDAHVSCSSASDFSLLFYRTHRSELSTLHPLNASKPAAPPQTGTALPPHSSPTTPPGPPPP